VCRAALSTCPPIRTEDRRQTDRSGAIAHGCETIATRNLLALDRAVYVAGPIRRIRLQRARISRTSVGRFRIITARLGVSDSTGRALNLERLSPCDPCRKTDKSDEQTNPVELLITVWPPCWLVGTTSDPRTRSLGLDPLANTQGVPWPCSSGTLRELSRSLVTKQQFGGKLS